MFQEQYQKEINAVPFSSEKKEETKNAVRIAVNAADRGCETETILTPAPQKHFVRRFAAEIGIAVLGGLAAVLLIAVLTAGPGQFSGDGTDPFAQSSTASPAAPASPKDDDPARIRLDSAAAAAVISGQFPEMQIDPAQLTDITPEELYTREQYQVFVTPEKSDFYQNGTYQLKYCSIEMRQKNGIPFFFPVHTIYIIKNAVCVYTENIRWGFCFLYDYDQDGSTEVCCYQDIGSGICIPVITAYHVASDQKIQIGNLDLLTLTPLGDDKRDVVIWKSREDFTPEELQFLLSLKGLLFRDISFGDGSFAPSAAPSSIPAASPERSQHLPSVT